MSSFTIIHLLSFQSFLTRKPAIYFDRYLYRETIDFNLVKRIPIWKEWSLFCDTATIFTRSFPYVHTNCLQTLVTVVYMCAHIVPSIEIAKNFVRVYLLAFHVNYSDIFSHPLTSFPWKLGYIRKCVLRYMLTKKVVQRMRRRENSGWVQLSAFLKKPFGPRIIKDRRTRDNDGIAWISMSRR